VLEDEYLPILKPIIEELLDIIDQNKQRAAAEMIGGVIGGKNSKEYVFPNS
jgi:proteasome activator subunit 4